MHCTRKITDELYYVGGDDRRLTLFENIHPVPLGVSYNSYLLLGSKNILFDAVDWSYCRNFLDNISYLLDGRTLDYVVVNHVEPDHGASMEEVLLRYPDVKIIATERAFLFMHQFGFDIDSHEQIIVKNEDSLKIGERELKFITASMVHWPEVMCTLELTTGAMFTADAFGSFRSLDGRIFDDEVNYERDFLDESRRYYFNIVGKYGVQVAALLKRIEEERDKVRFICPLHGIVWRSNLEYLFNIYDKWSRYESEEKGAVIVYASMYGNTENAAFFLASSLCEKGMTSVRLFDVSKTDASVIIAECCRVSHIVLASCTYNFAIYPPMESLLHHFKGIGLKNKTFAVIENGTWAIKSGDLMEKYIAEEIKNNEIIDGRVTVVSSLDKSKEEELKQLAESIVVSVNRK